MKSIDTWLALYSESHLNPTNQKIHWICIPLIILSLQGMLWSIPHQWSAAVLPEHLAPFLNFGSIFLFGIILYYTLLSKEVFFGMIPVALLMSAANHGLDQFSIPLWQSSIAIFVLAWIGQFVGHKIEGKKPSFFEDLQFLLIGPAWELCHLYRALGIAYSPQTRNQ